MKKCALILSAVLLSSLGSSLGFADESHPGLGLESEYSEAVLAYNRQQTAEALGILDKVLAENPSYIEALELKALVLKGEGKDRPSLETYLNLLKLKPPTERGPYYFEAAVLLNRMGRKEDAIAYFEAAIRLKFNVSASNLFLGILQFNSGDPKKAEPCFQAVLEEGLPEMKVVAHYYLGIIYLKQQYPAGGSKELLEAKELAETIPENKTASDTMVAVDRILEPFRKGQWFANLSGVIGYDSNISQTPNTSAAQAAPTNISTAQTRLSAGVGYMSPALQTIQWVPSFNASWNDNFNSSTKQFEFFSNNASLYLNYKPLDPITGGLKLQGTFTFNNQPNDISNPSGASTYSKYSLTGDLGPYISIQLSPRLQVAWEFDLIPQTYYTETTLSGTAYQTKASVRGETSSAYLNPAGSLTYENDSTSGVDLKYKSFDIQLADMIRPTIRDTISASVDLTFYSYYVSSAARSDTTWSPSIGELHTVNEHWSLVGNFTYYTNASTQASTFSYSRVVATAGAVYSF